MSLRQQTQPVSELATSTDSSAARSALRRIASGVTVLTVNLDGVRHGATVSAVVPISRDPLVLGEVNLPHSPLPEQPDHRVSANLTPYRDHVGAKIPRTPGSPDPQTQVSPS